MKTLKGLQSSAVQEVEPASFSRPNLENEAESSKNKIYHLVVTVLNKTKCQSGAIPPAKLGLSNSLFSAFTPD